MKTVSLCAVLFIFAACKTSPPASSCRYSGVVKDLSGIDGCGLVIEMKDGTTLLPVEFAVPGFTLKAGEAVKFDFMELKDRVSTCMGGRIVRIECIEETK
ncbi:hypothetical protein HHL17_15635 [Chitinophaga sp. G-6-1-13]|uniref:Uncharacterized protein n=1 Tax=Chitinophaga fulva TaxID=2728842 RepID=A0A848GPS1_9BACT|nr:hypothetical protein [Chitinophaga fulva]NML38640.1 hypothetical protein [Chitinophaga fulva]